MKAERTPPRCAHGIAIGARVSLALVTAWIAACGTDVPRARDAGREQDAAVDAGDDASYTSLLPGDTRRYEIPDVRPVPSPTCIVPTTPPISRSRVRVESVFADVVSGDVADEITVLLASPDERGRWYYARRTGQIYTFTEADDAPSLVLDLTSRIYIANGEHGVMGLAIDPDTTRSHRLYVAFSGAPAPGADHTSRLERFVVDEDGASGDLASAETVLTLSQPHPSHNANHIAFGPDGFLYQGIGDGGGFNDTYGNGQNVATIFAAIVRLDVHAVGMAYGIPSDNPFVGLAGYAPEIWAYGLRNPWRFSFDRATGDIWAGDVGQGTWEELDRIVPGGNYGWPLKEGPVCYLADPCTTYPVRDPVWGYTHTEGASITAGYRYRGSAIPSHQGMVFAADFVNGSLFSVAADETGETGTGTLELETGLSLVTFAEDWDGELYVVHYGAHGDGGIYAIRPAAQAGEDAFPKTLSALGCLDLADPYATPPGFVSYAPTAELWSDGAEKARYFVIPPDRRIATRDGGDFLLPIGSMLVKHFGFEGRPHETRILVHHASGFAGYTYRWNAAGTDADLLESSFSETLANGVRWVYPSRGQCVSCHTLSAGITLGLEHVQLAHAHADDAPSDLARMRAFALFNEEARSELDALAISSPPIPPPHGAAPVDARARGYLHANCAGCHRPGGSSARGNIDLRFGTSFLDTGTCNALPTEGTLYHPQPALLRIVAPGAPERSVLRLRMATTDAFRMPALGSGIVDDAAVALVDAWIGSLAACP